MNRDGAEWDWRVIGFAANGSVVASALCETEEMLEAMRDGMHILPGVKIVETMGPFRRRADALVPA